MSLIPKEAGRPSPAVLIVGAGPLAAAFARGLTYYGIAYAGTPRTAAIARVVADSPAPCVVVVVDGPADLDVTAYALAAGKHVYESEHPSRTRDEVVELLRLARAGNVLLSTGPDSFLGQTVQTARTVLSQGRIGATLSAGAVVPHADAGPDLDPGALPAFLSCVANLFGPIVAVAPDGTGAVLTSAAGVAVRLRAGRPDSEEIGVSITGTDGRLRLHHPAHYDRPVRMQLGADGPWQTVEPAIPPTTDRAGALFRGPGVRDLLAAAGGAAHRASAALRIHLLDAAAAVVGVLDGADAITLPVIDDRATA